MRVVGHVDQFGRGARLLFSCSYNKSQHVTGIRRALPDADEDRPVLVDNADVLCARNVRRGMHRKHAIGSERP
jgi:hypothetical protein